MIPRTSLTRYHHCRHHEVTTLTLTTTTMTMTISNALRLVPEPATPSPESGAATLPSLLLLLRLSKTLEAPSRSKRRPSFKLCSNARGPSRPRLALLVGPKHTEHIATTQHWMRRGNSATHSKVNTTRQSTSFALVHLLLSLRTYSWPFGHISSHHTHTHNSSAHWSSTLMPTLVIFYANSQAIAFRDWASGFWLSQVSVGIDFVGD